MFINTSNYAYEDYVAALFALPPLQSREIVAIYFSKNRAAIMIGEIFQPELSGVIITRQNGVYIPPPPKPKPILKISTYAESANPQINELEPLKKAGKRVIHNLYAPLKYFLKSHEDDVIDFDGELKNEVRELEEIFDYLNEAKRIEISEEKLTLIEIMKRPHFKYCMLMLLREFKMRLL